MRHNSKPTQVHTAPQTAALEQRYSLLKHYIGDIAFGSMSRAFLNEQPREEFATRKLCDSLPDFLATYAFFQRKPEINELARLELALHQACVAADVTALTFPELENYTLPDEIKLHPSAQHLVFFQNTTSIWSALKCGELPPKPHVLGGAQNILVWWQGVSARFRILGEEETLALAEIKNTQPNPFLRVWAEAELLLPDR